VIDIESTPRLEAFTQHFEVAKYLGEWDGVSALERDYADSLSASSQKNGGSQKGVPPAYRSRAGFQ
jgi:lipocalin